MTGAAMTERTINLDQHRGMAAQKATELRRLVSESQLAAAPSADWHEAAEKARYLLGLFATTPAAQDPRRQKLIEAVLQDFERLSRE